MENSEHINWFFGRIPEPSKVSDPKSVILPGESSHYSPFHSWPFRGFEILWKKSLPEPPHLKIDNSACPWRPLCPGGYKECVILLVVVVVVVVAVVVAAAVAAAVCCFESFCWT